MTTATVTDAGIRAFADAVGLPADDTVAGPLYLAARAMPDCIARAKTAVPAERHGAGLHVGHAIHQLRPVRPGEVIETTTTSTTRETTSGTLVTVHLDARSAAETVAAQRSTYLFRRDDPAGRPPSADLTPSDGPARLAAPLVVTLPVDAGAAYAEVSGDRQAIHLDDDVARAAGFPRAIVHGMYACAVVVAAVLRQRGLAHDAVTHVEVRFRAPLLWGDRLAVEVDGAGPSHRSIAFSATTERGVPALTHGRIGLAGAGSTETGARPT